MGTLQDIATMERLLETARASMLEADYESFTHSLRDLALVSLGLLDCMQQAEVIEIAPQRIAAVG